ncbi:MAG: DUF4160 domain-containing protein [Thiolinea sp.]
MPTLLVLEGFRFFFYANEHEPKHIHVIHGDSFAKIELGTLLVTNAQMKSKDLKKALTIVEENQDEFGRRWDEYFNQG